ncbi:MAG: hypothetical protein J6A75_13915 [Lachnospiraceae bacterium]|nr:hypothetical protein [Lachnospiraceae bacterium]
MKRKTYIPILIIILLLLVVGSSCIGYRLYMKKQNAAVLSNIETIEQTDSKNTILRSGIFQAFENNIFHAGIIPEGLEVVNLTPEQQAERVYSFSQGPRAYNEGRPWGGEWCQKIVKGNSFGGFGCGMCCMANIYSTISPYECSPWDMFEYATQVTYYYPSRDGGAIGWGDIKTTLENTGFECNVHRKPGSYEYFQEVIKKSKSAIVLVSSYNDDTFWEDTSGHYVNIYLYQEDTDMVFLAEPGDLEKNRTWVPLKYVYDALKTASNFHYLTVEAYDEEKNNWKHNGIDEIWNGK